jgi:replicative superfamily II helicase
MVDSLNAEIALGTITSVQDAIQWLGYTYLFVRMRREPFIYGEALSVCLAEAHANVQGCLTTS